MALGGVCVGGEGGRQKKCVHTRDVLNPLLVWGCGSHLLATQPVTSRTRALLYAPLPLRHPHGRGTTDLGQGEMARIVCQICH